ncbi:hypothetical protein QQP08_018065 [Theobroma cacao]|nr:hypothetical protein QQP08_018065 [Theobroma cacao]
MYEKNLIEMKQTQIPVRSGSYQIPNPRSKRRIQGHLCNEVGSGIGSAEKASSFIISSSSFFSSLKVAAAALVVGTEFPLVTGTHRDVGLRARGIKFDMRETK